MSVIPMFVKKKKKTPDISISNGLKEVKTPPPVINQCGWTTHLWQYCFGEQSWPASWFLQRCIVLWQLCSELRHCSGTVPQFECNHHAYLRNTFFVHACNQANPSMYAKNETKISLSSFLDRLLFVINAIKEEIVNRVQDISNDKETSMTEKLDKLIDDTLGKNTLHCIKVHQHRKCWLCVFKLMSQLDASYKFSCMLYKRVQAASS